MIHELIFEERPWGHFKVLLEGSKHKVKEIHVNPYSKLSLQSHEHREEIWVIAQGTAQVLCGAEEYHLTAGQSLYIPKQTKHRLINTSSEKLVVIETQLGSYLEEDDIQRFEDDYDRECVSVSDEKK